MGGVDVGGVVVGGVDVGGVDVGGVDVGVAGMGGTCRVTVPGQGFDGTVGEGRCTGLAVRGQRTCRV